MKTACLFFTILFVSLVVLLQGCACATSAKKSGGGDIPEIKKDCSICHPSHGTIQGSASLNKPIPELCIECHRDRIMPNEHKVGVVPTMDVKQLPLLDGRMTCVTCHDPHQNPYGYLLQAPARDLCFICHPY